MILITLMPIDKILGIRSISFSSQQSVDVMGLTGLDRLFSFMIVQQLQEYVKYMERVVTKEKSFLDLKTLAETNLMPVDRLTCEYVVSVLERILLSVHN